MYTYYAKDYQAELENILLNLSFSIKFVPFGIYHKKNFS